MSTLNPMICECCGGHIDRASLVCKMCGTSFLNVPTLGTSTDKDYGTLVTSGSTNLVTNGAVWAAINNLPELIVFKGSLGAGGTITSLPVDGTATVGDTYMVITTGTYAGQAAEIGDTFVCNSKTSTNTWVLVPSGDEPSGAVSVR